MELIRFLSKSVDIRHKLACYFIDFDGRCRHRAEKVGIVGEASNPVYEVIGAVFFSAEKARCSIRFQQREANWSILLDSFAVQTVRTGTSKAVTFQIFLCNRSTMACTAA